MIALCAGFASCGGGNHSSSSSSSKSTSTSTSSSTSSVELKTLSAPKNLEYYSNDGGGDELWGGVSYVVSWDYVKNADGYAVSINGEELETDETKINLTDYIEFGEETTITVWTKGDGAVYGDSEEVEFSFTPREVTGGIFYRYEGSFKGYSVSVKDENEWHEDLTVSFPDKYQHVPITRIGQYRNKKVESVFIPKNVKYISSSGFSSCVSLKTVTIEEGSELEEIKGGAFPNRQAIIEKIEIPKSVQTIENKALPRFKEIVVDEENENYCSIDGNLYSKDGTQFIQYAGAKEAEEFTVPSTVTEVMPYSFTGCEYLKRVKFDCVIEYNDMAIFYMCPALESVELKPGKMIYAFLIEQQCENFKQIDFPEGLEQFYVAFLTHNIKTVVLPQSLQKIHMESINSVKGPVSLYYKGTATQWQTVEYEESEKITVYFYSEDEPTEEGNFWHYDNDGNAVIWA